MKNQIAVLWEDLTGWIKTHPVIVLMGLTILVLAAIAAFR